MTKDVQELKKIQASMKEIIAVCPDEATVKRLAELSKNLDEIINRETKPLSTVEKLKDIKGELDEFIPTGRLYSKELVESLEFLSKRLDKTVNPKTEDSSPASVEQDCNDTVEFESNGWGPRFNFAASNVRSEPDEDFFRTGNDGNLTPMEKISIRFSEVCHSMKLEKMSADHREQLVMILKKLAEILIHEQVLICKGGSFQEAKQLLIDKGFFQEGIQDKADFDYCFNNIGTTEPFLKNMGRERVFAFLKEDTEFKPFVAELEEMSFADVAKLLHYYSYRYDNHWVMGFPEAIPAENRHLFVRMIGYAQIKKLFDSASASFGVAGLLQWLPKEKHQSLIEGTGVDFFKTQMKDEYSRGKILAVLSEEGWSLLDDVSMGDGVGYTK